MYALWEEKEIAAVVRERCKSLEAGTREARVMHVDGRALSPWLATLEEVTAAAIDAAHTHGRHAVRLLIATDI